LIPYPLPGDAVTDYPTTGRELATLLESLFVAAMQPSRTIIWQAGSGTYNTPAGALALLVECIGAGGGTPAIAINPTNGGIGGGGGGGAYASSLITDPAPTYPITVPAGGATTANQAAGAATFGSPAIVAAAGGVTGPAAAAAAFSNVQGGLGGSAGAPSLGQLTIPGDDATNGYILSTAQVLASRGGMAARGGGVPRVLSGASNNGSAGKAPGGGATGPFVAGSGTMAGAIGGAGLIVVTAFLPKPSAAGELEAFTFEELVTDWVPAPDPVIAPPVELPEPGVDAELPEV